MSSHAQSRPIGEKVHSAFGYVLIGAGIARIVERCFLKNPDDEVPEPQEETQGTGEVLWDADNATSARRRETPELLPGMATPRMYEEGSKRGAFAHLTPMGLVAGG